MKIGEFLKERYDLDLTPVETRDAATRLLRLYYLLYCNPIDMDELITNYHKVAREERIRAHTPIQS